MKKLLALAMCIIAFICNNPSAAFAVSAHHPQHSRSKAQGKAHKKQTSIHSKGATKPKAVVSEHTNNKALKKQKSASRTKDLSKEGRGHSSAHSAHQGSAVAMSVKVIHPNVTLPDMPADGHHPLPNYRASKNASASKPIATPCVKMNNEQRTVIEPKRNIFQSFWHGFTAENTSVATIQHKAALSQSDHWATHFGNHDKQDSGVGSPLCLPFENGRMGIRTSSTYGVALPIELLMARYGIKDFKWSSWQKVRDAGIIVTNGNGKSLPIAPFVDLGPGRRALKMGHDVDLTKPASDIFGGDGPCTYKIVDNAFKGKHLQFQYAYHPLISRGSMLVRKHASRKYSTLLASNSVKRH